MDIFYAAVTGIIIIFAPVLLLGALLLSLLAIIAPVILRALLPASNTQAKWFVVFILAALQMLWIYFRGPIFWSELTGFSFHAAHADWLIVAAWLVLLGSLVILSKPI